MTDLLPCPFCGAPAHNEGVWVGCTDVKCAASGPFGNSYPEAAEAWNNRAGNTLLALLRDPAYAATFQSLGQYRTALIKAATSIGEPQ